MRSIPLLALAMAVLTPAACSSKNHAEQQDVSPIGKVDGGMLPVRDLSCDQGKAFAITASDYDQSCNEDSDCIGIGEGNGCDCQVACTNAAININDEASWKKDLQKVPKRATICHCPASTLPCCANHRCSVDHAMCQRAGTAMDAGDEDADSSFVPMLERPSACTAAGGQCVFEPKECERVGPSDCSPARGICCKVP